MKNIINIAVIGGSGFWSEQSHYKHVLGLRKHQKIRLVAVVDIIDPTNIKDHVNLQKIMAMDRTSWINPNDYKNTDAIINHLKQSLGVNFVIIASNPCTHFDYGMSCIRYRLNVLCDKPFISTRNASTDPSAAKEIYSQFKRLTFAYDKARNDTPQLLFHSILRRRSLEPFEYVARELKKVHDSTGAGINNMTILVNGGIYKFPAEFIAPGAHGYLEGVGSLAHSAYHYIDVLAWFLSQAPGAAVKIKPKLNYVLRIKDYIEAQSYLPLANTVGETAAALAMPILSEEVLGCELNSGFTFLLLDNKDTSIGEITFLFNHMSFTPRTRLYSELVHEPANMREGGRMSHFMIDVNQEGLQSWQIDKNDIVFEGNTINLHGRRHPNISGDNAVALRYANAYEPELTMEDLLGHTLQCASEHKYISHHSVIRSISEERLATQIYASCYQLIAKQYCDPSQSIASDGIGLSLPA